MVTPATNNEATDAALNSAPAVVDQQVLATELAPASGAPADISASETTVATPPSAQALQEELQSLRSQVAAATAVKNEAITAAILQSSAQKVYDEELAAGLSAEDALRIAKRHYVTKAEVMAQSQLERDRQTAAEYVGQKYRVSPEALMSGTSGEHMMEIAQRIILEQRIAALERGRVQPQRFDSGSSARAGGALNYAELLKKGGALPSAAEIDRLTAKYLQQR